MVDFWVVQVQGGNRRPDCALPSGIEGGVYVVSGVGGWTVIAGGTVVNSPVGGDVCAGNFVSIRASVVAAVDVGNTEISGSSAAPVQAISAARITRNSVSPNPPKG